MTSFTDDQLFEHASRVKDRTVIITGGANGIGKETALQLARHGAKLVIADLNLAASVQLVSDIVKNNGQATAKQCDVTNWDSQVDVFEHALQTFGSVDVVVACAGVTEIGQFAQMQLDKNGRPKAPETKTLQINLMGSIYTASLARHYLQQNHDPRSSDLKALVFIASMSSWQAIPLGPMYSASKHGVLGVMRSLTVEFELLGIRIASIHPWFADTSLVPIDMKLFLAGIPLTPITRVAGAITYAVTSPGKENHGCTWLLPDNGPVCRLEQEVFKMGVYGLVDQRFNALLKGASGVQHLYLVLRDLWKLLKLKKVLSVLLLVGIARVVWLKRALLLQ